jgi:hypothetical protein
MPSVLRAAAGGASRRLDAAQLSLRGVGDPLCGVRAMALIDDEPDAIVVLPQDDGAHVHQTCSAGLAYLPWNRAGIEEAGQQLFNARALQLQSQTAW